MKIESVELYQVRIPVKEPWVTAHGIGEALESIFVRISSRGIYGWGESTPSTYYSPESPSGVFATCREFLIPLVLGMEVQSGDDLQTLMSPVKGNQFAKAAIDLAWWDLTSKGRGQPLWRVIGGENQAVDVGMAFGVEKSVDILLSKIEQAVAAGYRRIKLKFRPGWGIRVIDAVRKVFPDTVLHIDCNSAYSLDDLGMFVELDKYNLAMCEQPLAYDDLIDHAELSQAISTPICLDESIKSPDHARKAAKIGACQYVNIKPGRVGGITNALKIHDICHRAGVPCWIGGMGESSLGRHFMLALGTLPNIGYPSDIGTTPLGFAEEVSVPKLILSGPSQMTAPDGPGCGAEPDPERLVKYTRAKEVVS